MPGYGRAEKVAKNRVVMGEGSGVWLGRLGVSQKPLTSCGFKPFLRWPHWAKHEATADRADRPTDADMKVAQCQKHKPESKRGAKKRKVQEIKTTFPHHEATLQTENQYKTLH